MRIAIIGRTEVLLETAELLLKQGHSIPLVITAKEAPEYKKNVQDFRSFSEKIGATFIRTSRILDTFDSILSLLPIDISVSMNYVGIIPQKIIDCFRLGIVNVHGGDLPRYRGNACQAWAILNGEKYIGLCIHRMIGGELDSGDIVAREYLPIDHDMKITQVLQWMSERIPSLSLEAVENLMKDPHYVLERQSRDPKDVLRCYPREPGDGRIDWNQSNLQILRLVNASNKPYSGAYCKFRGKKLIIWSAELVEDGEGFLAVPGQVTKIAGGIVEVATSRGKLRLKEVEYDGELKSPTQIIKSIRERLT